MMILTLTSFIFVSCTENKENKTTDLSDNKKANAITAAGATFPLPYYNKIFKTYTKDSGKILVTYGGIGSGGGIRSLQNKIVDFGATDAYLTDEKLKKMDSEILHIPTCIGAVVAAYNLPDNPKLKLTPEILSSIFLGKINNWNDPMIKKINKEIDLPNLDITVVHRSDGSGTTKIFSDYLSKVNSEWKEKVGSGKSLKWPVGIGAKGNPGVAGNIKQTKGSIGYIGYEFAKSQNLPVATVQNQKGKFITPSIETITEAANKEIPNDTRAYITNSDSENGYPISGFTWLIFYKEQSYNSRSYDQALQTLKLLDWILNEKAQSTAKKVNYAPLPKSIVAKGKEILRTATYNGKKILK
ncbi:MAG: phosphate ABC transporter substrate-binding protein PstS [Candidatus Cloacimonadota bacterium]|nr:MAG: phosphate ABC transporter substrate-binding protein PstS [Candidatus Cloacimonadota bacterium]PIE77713.1 MAG: phosphate ABC transporter substrate-binding protein PstS [Candidatus Delongbacteria bacterium]